jgi:hypothetical protein
MSQFYLMECMIESGGFSGEKTFEIDVPNGDRLIGTASIDYVRDENRQPLDEATPGYGERIRGFVVCRKIRQTDGNRILIEVPSTDVIHVDSDVLIDE